MYCKIIAFAIVTGLIVPGHGVGGTDSCINTPKCKCKWSSGKSVADCSNAGLTRIPSTLKPETQIIILDGNPIGGLNKDTFKNAGLVNLHKISMRNCSLKFIDENALNELRILIDLDLSFNDISKLKLKTFEGNPNLQFLKMAHNPMGLLQAFQFPQLKNLKMLDFSFCGLETIDPKTFQNLGASVETIYLNDNQLKYLEVGLFTSLSLRTIELQNNPWVCDCRLNGFREWLLNKQIDTRPAVCKEPQRLYEKLWDELLQSDFACKPEIIIPQRFVTASLGVNTTLSCLISGSPSPRVQWVKDGLTVGNNSSPKYYPDQLLIVREEQASPARGSGRWYNLTLSSIGPANLGDYVCVAENGAGMMERNVTLTFGDPDRTPTENGGVPSDAWAVAVGIPSAGIVFLGSTLLFCCRCLCRQKKVAEKKSRVKGGAAGVPGKKGVSAFGNETTPTSPGEKALKGEEEALLTWQGESLLSYPLTQGGTRLVPGVRGEDGLSLGHSFRRASAYGPDLLEPSTLGRVSPSPSTSRHATLPVRKTSFATPLSVDGLAALPRSGTLPHFCAAHRGSGRSPSGGRAPGGPVRYPTVGPVQKAPPPPRPGYVTLPRRPRADPPPRRTEPVYDGIGPRTGADGSSGARPDATDTFPRRPPPFEAGLSGRAPPPRSPPVFEAREGPPTPKGRPRSGPDRRRRTFCSEIDATLLLLEENVGAYCEPFGKALPPFARDDLGSRPLTAASASGSASTRGSPAARSSAGSELELLLPRRADDGAVPPDASAGLPFPAAASRQPRPFPKELERSQVPSAERLREVGSGGPSPVGPNVHPSSKRVPPETLPKPKAVPVPPPKPRTRAVWASPPSVSPRFQDEGQDGSEV